MKEPVAEGAAQVVDLLQDLRSMVNFPKSQLYPVQRIVYLGFLINLQDGMVQIPDGKVRGVFSAMDCWLRRREPIRAPRGLRGGKTTCPSVQHAARPLAD